MTKPIRGAGGGGKGGGGSARVPVEAKDSLRSRAYAKVLDLVSEGEIEGLVNGLQSIYLDGTPIQNEDGTYNFKGLEVATRTGSQAQSYIPGFSTVENTIQVGVEVKELVPVVRQITNPNLDAILVTIGIPQLSYQDPSNGDLGGTTLQYAIDVQSNGGGFVPQVLGQTWDGSGMTTISPAWFRSSTSDTRGMQILCSGVITNQLYRMEYRLVGSGTWLTAGVTFAYSGGSKLRDSVLAASTGGLLDRRSNTFTTPTLEAGQWEARIVKISDGSAPPTSYEIDGAFGATYTRPITYTPARLYGSPFETITGKTSSRYQRSHLVRLTGSAPWDIRVRRITADSTQVNLQNKSWWDTYTEIIDAKLRYPNSAVVGLRIDASQFQSIPTRGYDMKLLRVRVPTNYDPETRAYTGSWDGSFQVAWTDNPAWCFYDLLTNERYGLGGMIDAAQVDKWALYQIGRYCDELVPDGFGGTEPRFTCNLYLQTRQEAYKVLQDFASIFRGMVFWATGSVTAVQDAPADPVALFTAANVVEGKFAYSGSSLKARHTVALVTWNDPDDMYRQKVEYVEDQDGIARYGVQQTEFVAVGCTSRGQANRAGRWLLYSERAETETVQFSVGLDGAVVRPGHIIKVSDATRAAARLGGRVKASTATSVTVDKAPALDVTGWTLYATLADGTVEQRSVSSRAGDTLNVGTAFTSAPAVQGIWILSAPSVEAQTFRVITVAEDQGSGTYAITALKHEPLKYDAIENGMVLQPRDFTLLNDKPPAPGGLVLGESLYTYQAEVRAKISIGWEGVEGVYTYFVDWRRNDGNWNRQETKNTDIELLDITPGTFDVKVYSSNPAGILSADSASGTIVALGKTAPPSDVAGFGYNVDASTGVSLVWDRVPDLDIDSYEVRDGASWDTATLVGQVKGTILQLGALPVAAKTYTVKALDTSGVYSSAAASVSFTLAAAGAPTVAATFAGDSVLLSWNAVQGDLATADYEVRFGASFAGGTSLGSIKGTSLAIKAQWSGARTFWVAARDIAGSLGAAGQAVATVNTPVAVTVTQEVIDNNVLLRWGDATATLPVDFYELRRGATWASATVIGRVSARFSAIFESSAGTFTYRIRGYDVAGNEGAESTVLALVNQPPDYSLQYNQDSAFGGTRSNFVAYPGGQLTPVSATETWQAHFTSRGWNTPQDQINAGFPIYAQPSTASGSYEEVIDYGTLLAATKITATLTLSAVSGTVVATPTISVSATSASGPWTDYAGSSSAFVSNFRWAKIRYDFSSTGGDDLITITGLNVRFDVKLKNDAGSVNAVSTDAGGTTVTFNIPFVDVQSITLSPKGTAARIAVYDFSDVPNPTSFKVLLFDTAGNRVSGEVGWSVKGV